MHVNDLHIFVPEGHSEIAQRFNVGLRAIMIFSPEGTAELSPTDLRAFSRPSAGLGQTIQLLTQR